MIWKFNEIKQWWIKLSKNNQLRKQLKNERNCNHKNEDGDQTQQKNNNQMIRDEIEK